MVNLTWDYAPDRSFKRGKINGDGYLKSDDFEGRMFDAIEDVWQAFGGMLSDNACCEIAELMAEGKIKGIDTTFGGDTPLPDYPEDADAAWVADMLDFHNKRKGFADELRRMEWSKVYGIPMNKQEDEQEDEQEDGQEDEQGNNIASALENLKY